MSIINYTGGQGNEDVRIQTTDQTVTGAGGQLVDDNFKRLADRSPVSKYDNTTAPGVTDDGANTSGNGVFQIGSRWIDTTNDKVYTCVDNSTSAAVWIEVTGVAVHALGGAEHTADTLVNLNSKVSDATLVDSVTAPFIVDQTGNGKVIVEQIAGGPTKRIELSHNGTNGIIDLITGGLEFLFAGVKKIDMDLSGGVTFFSNLTFGDALRKIGDNVTHLNELFVNTIKNNSDPLVAEGVPGVNIGGFPSGNLHVTNKSAVENANAVITGHNLFGGNKQLWYLGSVSGSNDDIAFINRQNARLFFSTNNIERIGIEAGGQINFLAPGGAVGVDELQFILTTASNIIQSPAGSNNTVVLGYNGNPKLNIQVEVRPGITGTKLGINGQEWGASFFNNTMDIDLIADVIALNIEAFAGQTADLFPIKDSAAAILSRFNKAGFFMTRKIAAPADGDLVSSEMSVWWKDTIGSAGLQVKGKDSAGTVVNQSISGGSSDFVLVETQTASGVSSVDFTDLSTYKNFLLVIQRLTRVNNFNETLVRVQTGGATWEADANDYEYAVIGADKAGADANNGSTSATALQLNTTNHTNQPTDVGQFRIFFGDVDDTSRSKLITWNGFYTKSPDVGFSVNGGGQFTATTAITGIRVLASTGNISGVFKLYGMN